MIDFNMKNIYNSIAAERYKKQTQKMLKLLFEDLMENIKTVGNSNGGTPLVYKTLKDYLNDMGEIYTETDPDELKILDFIAGMTDTFAVRSFQELFEPRATV
jgi:dGTP triphosphohydrolase